MNHTEATQYIKATLLAFGPCNEANGIQLRQDTWAKLHEAMSVLIEHPAQADGNTIVQTFTGLPKRKLRELLSGGWAVNGVCIHRIEGDGTVRRGAVTTGGMVLWWNADQSAQEQQPEQPAQQKGRDWSLLEATQESLREHMAEIKHLRSLVRPEPEQPAPCCGKYETCSQPCTPRGQFLGKREALAEQPAHPDRVRELECVIADLKAECQSLRAEQPAQESTGRMAWVYDMGRGYKIVGYNSEAISHLAHGTLLFPRATPTPPARKTYTITERMNGETKNTTEVFLENLEQVKGAAALKREFLMSTLTISDESEKLAEQAFDGAAWH